MTRKDFIMLATALADVRRENERAPIDVETALRRVAEYVGDGCARRNEFFDRQRFLTACGFEAA